MRELQYHYYRKIAAREYGLFFRKDYRYSKENDMFTAFVICSDGSVGKLTAKADTLLDAMCKLDVMLEKLTDMELLNLYENG